LLYGAVLLLGACGSDDGETSSQGSVSDGEVANEYGAVDHGIDEKKVGFSLSGDKIEEATDIPTAEKELLIKSFDKYIETLNDKDIDAYLATLSEKKYDLVEEREFAQEQFDQFDINREASNVTVVKYSETEAQVFAEIKMLYKQLSTGLETKPSGRQVTVFTKDDGEWKVESIHFIGDEQTK